MFRHRSAILMESTNTDYHKSSTPVQVLIALINTWTGVLDLWYVVFVDSRAETRRTHTYHELINDMYFIVL
jgi:hypothetical protein